MNITREEKLKLARELLDELVKTLDTIEDCDYKLDFVAYDSDTDDYLLGEEECNNWNRSWC